MNKKNNSKHEWVDNHQFSTMRDGTPQHCKKCGEGRIRYWRVRNQEESECKEK